MTTLAVIGSGIAGMGCAYLLRNRFDVTVFEKGNRIGGHTNTVEVDEHGKKVQIDTGFMVYNEATYPNLTRLFAALGVVSKPTDMSFSVQHDKHGFEWSGTGFNRLFGDRRNILSVRFWRFLFKLDKFNKDALLNVENSEFNDLSVRDYVQRLGYGEDFLELYLLPMMSALWSASPQVMLGFPIASLLRFMSSHGLLSVYGQHQWLTVDQGSRTYMEKLREAITRSGSNASSNSASRASFTSDAGLNSSTDADSHSSSSAKSVNVSNGIRKVTRHVGSVSLETFDNQTLSFDKCIIATHADQALDLLSDVDETERSILSTFKYQKNIATLHTYAGVMPEHRANWASWNYRLESGKDTSTHYWMNSLQGLSHFQDYFVSIGGVESIPLDRVLRQIDYEHPIFTVDALRAQRELIALNQRQSQNVYFAGSYFRYGFHEDAFNSAVQLSELLGGEEGWTAKTV